jgi:hypothetical protein
MGIIAEVLQKSIPHKLVTLTERNNISHQGKT